MDNIQPITTQPTTTIVDPAAVQAAPTIVTETTPAPVAPAPVAVEAPKPAPSLVTEPPKEPTTLLASTEPPKAPTEVKPTDGGQSAEPAPPPEVVPKEVQFEAFSIPEGIQADNESIGNFTNLLKSLETEGKADHTILQKQGQELMNFHFNELKKHTEAYNKQLLTQWDKQLTDWRQETIADPILGGPNLTTTLTAAQEFIRTHGGTEAEQAEFRSLMDSSGLGNNKVMVRIFANAMKANKEGQPLAAQSAPTTPKSRVTTMYGNS